MKRLIDNGIYRPVNPSPAALITSVDENGRPNIIPMGEVFNISVKQPVIVGIAIRPVTYSHFLIRNSGEFVVNLTTAELVEKVDRCGNSSGKGGIDKFKEFGLTPLPSKHVKPPLIEECVVNLECKVKDFQTIGDHDLFFGEVVAMHIDEDKTDDQGKIKWDQIDLLVFLTGSYWSLGKKIGDRFFTKENYKGQE